MKTHIVVFLLLSLIVAKIKLNHLSRVKMLPNFPSTVPNLGFKNFTGKCITKDQYNATIKILNEASYYYNDDVFQNLQYITRQLTLRYGNLNSYFYVYLMTKAYANGYTVYTKDGCSFM